MTKTRAPRHRADARGAGRGVFGHPTRSEAGSQQLVAGPGQRLIPAPLVSILRKRFPRLVGGVIENDDVYLCVPDRRGRPEAWRYRASPEFMTAVRVAESGLDNLLTLIGPDGFKLTLEVPEEDRP